MTIELHRPNRSRAIAALGVLAILVLAGCSDTSRAGQTGAGQATTPSGDEPSGVVETGTSTAAVSASGYPIIGEGADGPLPPGRYALAPEGGPDDVPLATVDVPAGFSSAGSFIYRDEPVYPDEPLEIGLWDITGVYMDPCQMSKEVSTTSVRDVADAFGRQPLMSATRPRAVNLGGYHGLYLEVRVPHDLTLSTCDDYEVNLWEGRPDGGFWTREAGLVLKLWILDVDGQQVAIHMAVPPMATGPQIDEMTNVVQSAAFEPR